MTTHVWFHRTNWHRLATGAASLLLWAGSGGSAVAAPMVFTDSAAFLAALSGPVSVVDFDDVDAETPIAEGVPFAGITFTTNLATPGLVVSDHFDTTSPLNYLGVDDGFSNEFQSGHELTFTFSRPVSAFGLFVIGSPGDVLPADLQLVAAGASVFNVGTPERTLFDGGDVFFLGIIDPTGFATAQLLSFGDPDDPFFAFNVDDLTTAAVPEPASLSLLGLGLLVLARRRAGRPGPHRP